MIKSFKLKIKNNYNVIAQPEIDNIKTANHLGVFVKNKIINAKMTKVTSFKFFKEDNILDHIKQQLTNL